MQSSLPPNLGFFTLGEIVTIQNNTLITKIFFTDFSVLCSGKCEDRITSTIL